MNEPVPDPRTIPTEPPSPSEEFGEVFVGRHRLIRKIGSGGMGTVYEAEQEQPRRRVAVKLLNTALTSPAQLVRFADESQHLAGLRHPNIAHVIEAGTQRYGALEVPYFAMEYVEGGRPITTFAEQEQLTTAQRLRLFEQVCAAVHHAHAQHVLHRDLKPANILVDVDGRPKLIDFGIARGLGAGTGAHAQTLTQPSEVVGTPQYMSPEQLAPQRVELDRRSDVYALGLVLYELLCGQPPYDLKGTTHAEAARIVRERPVPRPRRRNPRLSRDLETVILKALRKHRNARYASAAELGEDVRRVLSGEAVGPHGDGTVRRAAAAVRRGVARHAVASGLFVGAAAFLIALALGAWAERFETTAKVECLLTTHVPFAPAGPLEHVRMIALRPGTDVRALAVREGLADVDPDRVQSVRRLHGRLMEKLAGAGARVVAWDFGFNSSDPSFDPDLVRGIRELRQSGTAVVLVVPDWRVDGRGRPMLSAAIPEDVPWGSSIVQLYPDLTWTVNLAVEYQANHCVPALALSAAAAFWRPFAEASYEFGLWDVEVHYRNPRGSADWRAVPITSIDEWRRPQPGIGLDGGEPVAQFYVQVPSDADLEASTVDYGEVFSASPRQLSEWFAGRAVVIGDARGTREPLRAHPDGRLLPSVVAHAVALDWLIDGRAIRRPHALEVWNFYVGPRFAAELFTAGLACALALALARRPRTLIAALLALCGVLAGASVAAFAGAGMLLAPHGAVLVLVLVACCVWSVNRWGRGVELG